MEFQEALIAYPKTNEELASLKAFLKSQNISFEFSADKKYNPQFVEKILNGKNDIDQGKGQAMTLEELEALCK